HLNARLSATFLSQKLIAKSAWRHEINPHAVYLRFPPQAVRHVIFDLGTTGSPLRRLLLPCHSRSLAGTAETLAGTVRDSIFTYSRVWPQGDLDGDVFKAEIAIDLKGLTMEVGDFRFDLFLGTEDMTVVLSEGSYTHDAMQCAGRLIAMTATELAKAHRQL